MAEVFEIIPCQKDLKKWDAHTKSPVNFDSLIISNKVLPSENVDSPKIKIDEMTLNNTLLGMTPSSMALSLINCNPIVANDPILNSSLTSLATQILHMEHLIQVYMVS